MQRLAGRAGGWGHLRTGRNCAGQQDACCTTHSLILHACGAGLVAWAVHALPLPPAMCQPHSAPLLRQAPELQGHLRHARPHAGLVQAVQQLRRRPGMLLRVPAGYSGLWGTLQRLQQHASNVVRTDAHAPRVRARGCPQPTPACASGHVQPRAGLQFAVAARERTFMQRAPKARALGAFAAAATGPLTSWPAPLSRAVAAPTGGQTAPLPSCP